ncbi:MAG: hypothetical protein AB1598_05420 [Thermodesulfobacteriota bacterium]
MKYTLALLSLLFAFMLSCAPATNVEPEKTQLQIREYQTRTYEVKDPLMVMKAVANVLQDDGYIIKDAEVDLGIISASKEVDIESGWEAFFSVLAFGANARWKKNMIIESTANVSGFGDKVKVRVNFQAKALNNKGEVIEVAQIEEEKFYQDFFAKVDKGIFIQKEEI